MKMFKNQYLLATVAERSKARNVFARLNAGIVDSDPTQGIDVYLRLFCVFVDSDLATR
jgi:hypothetical protein